MLIQKPNIIILILANVTVRRKNRPVATIRHDTSRIRIFLQELLILSGRSGYLIDGQ